MGSRIRCFWIEPTDRARLRLRRFTYGGERQPTEACPNGPMSGHDASVSFQGPLDGAWPARFTPEGYLGSYDDLKPAEEDPRWPTHCEQCDRPFTDWTVTGNILAKTVYQVFQELLYRAPDGREMTLRDAPPGAMYDADWYPEKGPDGRALIVCLPPGGGLDYWHVDGPSSNGNGWTRTGTPPDVTATPSILTPRYHGHLKSGWLEACGDSPT